MFASLAVLLLLCARICAGFRFLRVEEGKGLEIDCGEGKAIYIIQASYGNVLGARKLCHAPSSKTEVSGRCRMEQKCFLTASNDIFGDPCKGESKHLDVLYMCYRPNPYASRAKTICEGKSGSIKCPRGSRIRVWQASYGRLDDAKCRQGQVNVTTCHAKGALLKVAQACSRRNSCNVTAANSVFGDPCAGTYKYLHVIYSCTRRRQAEIRRASTYKVSKTRIAVFREDGNGKSLSCRGNGRLSILGAGYGMFLKEKCRFKSQDLIKIRNRCHLRKSCFLTAGNYIFTEKCGELVKMPYVRFRCVYKIRVCKRRTKM